MILMNLAFCALGSSQGQVPADMPQERADTNSRLAHQQLVEKAHQGRIDLYFVGDSITRRWGTKDLAYREFLAHWRESFHGWNAGNFGWGGDTTQNILWRLQNGELDGVNPKVIVVLAGTNNIGAGATPADVAKGVAAVVDVCLCKAPKATVILTAIFPRNDDMRFVPTIQKANLMLADQTRKDRVRFLDLSERLADKQGKLVEGVTVDSLHLSLKGYQIWADGLLPILNELLGPHSDRDLAPQPTGDPSASG